jgi:hypothetical protein
MMSIAPRVTASADGGSTLAIAIAIHAPSIATDALIPGAPPATPIFGERLVSSNEPLTTQLVHFGAASLSARTACQNRSRSPAVEYAPPADDGRPGSRSVLAIGWSSSRSLPCRV